MVGHCGSMNFRANPSAGVPRSTEVVACWWPCGMGDSSVTEVDRDDTCLTGPAHTQNSPDVRSVVAAMLT
jgi:hypothetical protein